MGVTRNTTQSPAGYAAINLVGAPLAARLTGPQIAARLAADDVGSVVTPRTGAEITAGIVPVARQYAPQRVLRYQANPVPGTTAMDAGIQAAVDSSSVASPLVLIEDNNGIAKPILLRAGTTENIGFTGNGRVVSVISPLAAVISQAPQNINTCFFNQNNNPHVHWKSMRFISAAAFTGSAIFCLENGGADASGQCIFSAVLSDIWCDLGLSANCFAIGCWQNSVMENMTCENMKGGVFNFQGVGSGDNHFKSISMVNCFDQFIVQNVDTNGSFGISVNGVHVYEHNRGLVFDLNNWSNCVIENVLLETNTGTVLANAIGLLKLTTANGVIFNDFNMLTRTGVPPGATIIELNACTNTKISNGQVNGDIGLLLSGAVAFDVDVDNVDFTVMSTACLRSTTTAASGRLRTRNSKFNNSQASCVLHTANATYDWASYNDEYLNAGLGAASSARNLNLNPGAGNNHIFYSPRIGQNNVAAAAANFVSNSNVGTVTLVNPVWVGAPPAAGAYITNVGGGVVNVIVTPAKILVPYSASMTFNALLGTEFDIVPSNAVAFTVNAPTNPWEPMRITVRIKNTTAGALGAVTWGAGFKLSAWTQPAAGFSRSIDFTYDSASGAWVQDSQTGVDVPN